MKVWPRADRLSSADGFRGTRVAIAMPLDWSALYIRATPGDPLSRLSAGLAPLRSQRIRSSCSRHPGQTPAPRALSQAQGRVPVICLLRSCFACAPMKGMANRADSQSMEPNRDFVILIDALGHSLRLTTGLWIEVLRTAEANGWQPARTEPPPRDWSLSAPVTATQPWDGDYLEPRGQLVARADAVGLGTALQSAPQLTPKVAAVAEFCIHDSFMICPLSPELQTYLSGGLQLSFQIRHILDVGTVAPETVEMPESSK